MSTRGTMVTICATHPMGSALVSAKLSFWLYEVSFYVSVYGMINLYQAAHGNNILTKSYPEFFFFLNNLILYCQSLFSAKFQSTWPFLLCSCAVRHLSKVVKCSGRSCIALPVFYWQIPILISSRVHSHSCNLLKIWQLEPNSWPHHTMWQ